MTSIPSLAGDDLCRGDIVYETDYRRYYATLASFLGLDSSNVLGAEFTALPILS